MAYGHTGDDVEMQQASVLDLPLSLLSAASYGQGIYEAGRHYALIKNSQAMLREANRLKNSFGAFASRQTMLLKSVASNINALEAMEVASKRMFLLGALIGAADVWGAKPEDRLNKAGWLVADTAMGLVGMTPLGAPVALVYFTGRFLYGVYEAGNSE